jgi:2-polyprenyl-6-methoxyphenol hydroxylase-like FAD-dependent oxidoreductase
MRDSIDTDKDYDVAIVGASLAGCATAIFLARSGARVALVEKQPDAAAFKRVCSHYVQPSAGPTLDRLGMLEPMLRAGAVRSRIRVWTPWGWIAAPRGVDVGSGINLRREKLDPLIRGIAASTAGVEPILGNAVQGLLRTDGETRGVLLSNPRGGQTELRARLVVGADGRNSTVARLAGIRARVSSNGRFTYGGYFEGGLPDHAPDGSLWLMDPQTASAFPTDAGLTLYACMLTKEHLSAFRGHPAEALVSYVERLPDPPPIRDARLIGRVWGKLEMPNLVRKPIAPGLALVGDAALAADPLAGVGCGWALRSAEWLASSIGPAITGTEPLNTGLRRYRRTHARAIGAHALIIRDYATGRKTRASERLVLSAAARNQLVAREFEALFSGTVGPARFLAATVPLATVVNVRHIIAGRKRAGEPAGAS